MRIALIHAVAVAIAPVNDALARLWPEAEAMNLLDDTLSVDRAKSAAISPAIAERILRLARYARDGGADGILFTCSAFGLAIAAAADALDVPVLKPNDAMFARALDHGTRIAMLATFEPSIGSMEEEFRELVARRGAGADLVSRYVPDAMPALRHGDGTTHDRLIAEAARTLAPCDAIMLAQFSTARAASAVAKATGRPVLTSPDSAVLALRASLAA